MERRAWPIVVGGAHRSGTSLVRRLLDAHPRIHCGPEVPFFRDFHGDYRDDLFRHLRFAAAARSLLPEDELLGVLGGAHVELHRRAAARAGKARWADKAPENVLHLEGWQRLLGEEWLFVHVVRNPLDTVASMTRAGFPLTLPADLAGRTAHYCRYVEAGLAFGERAPGRTTRVVYEELCADPAAALSRLMTGLGEEPDPRQLAFNDVTHEVGLEDRRVGLTTAVEAGRVGGWTETLGEEDAAAVWQEAGPLWRRLDPDLLFCDTPVSASRSPGIRAILEP